MADLDEAIREWLRPAPTVDHWHEWMHHTRGALTAVLDRHKPRKAIEGPYAGRLICDGCSDGTDEFLATAHPCETVRDIARELGIGGTRCVRSNPSSPS